MPFVNFPKNRQKRIRWHVANPDNQHALIHHVWEELAERILRIDHEEPGVWGLSEFQLIQWVKPTRLLQMIRIQFWHHVYEARNFRTVIHKDNIAPGLCSDEVWYKILNNDANVVFICHPIQRVDTTFEALYFGIFQKLYGWVESIDPKKMDKAMLTELFRTMRLCEYYMGYHPNAFRKGPSESAVQRMLKKIKQQTMISADKRINESEPLGLNAANDEHVSEFEEQMKELPAEVAKDLTEMSLNDFEDDWDIEGESDEGSDQGDGAKPEAAKRT